MREAVQLNYRYTQEGGGREVVRLGWVGGIRTRVQIGRGEVRK